VVLKPFPELTGLQLSNAYEVSEPKLPDSFLGGSAPRLRSLHLEYIAFPALPKLLLSTTHLVHLDLEDIPDSGRIPPEVMATSLSALTSLESLVLNFAHSRQEILRPRPPPLPHSILPNLTKIEFRGASEYFEVILARIDAPRVHK
jgi:hypothetical protein